MRVKEADFEKSGGVGRGGAGRASWSEGLQEASPDTIKRPSPCNILQSLVYRPPPLPSAPHALAPSSPPPEVNGLDRLVLILSVIYFFFRVLFLFVALFFKFRLLCLSGFPLSLAFTSLFSLLYRTVFPFISDLYICLSLTAAAALASSASTTRPCLVCLEKIKYGLRHT